MCIMWMPANLISSGIVDKNDKIFKKENKNAHVDEENTPPHTENTTAAEQTEKNKLLTC